jgi:TonB family protein
MRTKLFFLTLLALSLSLTNIYAQEAGAPSKPVPKIIEGGVINGKAVSLPKPAYPAAAKAVRASGAVNVQVTIDEEGNVISASAVSGHPLLRAAAVSAAREAKFSPTKLSGVAVKVTGIIVYNFVLPKEATESNASERLIPMRLVMFLTALKDIPSDDATNRILHELGDEIPAGMSAQKAQIERLARAKTPGEKSKLIDEIIASMRRDLTGTDIWMIDFGMQWGSTIGEAFKITESNYGKDRQTFIKGLQGMNRLLESPPKDIPEEVLEKIRAISSYNDEADAISPEYISDFFKSSLDFIQSMIDNGKSGN